MTLLKVVIIKLYKYLNNQMIIIKKMVVFDDYVCEKKQGKIIEYFIRGRHKNCSVIYLLKHQDKTPSLIVHIFVFMNFQAIMRLEYAVKIIQTGKNKRSIFFSILSWINQRS